MSFEFNAEHKAEVATKLPAFPINLVEIRRTVKDILSQFGGNLIFREFTTHDISHVDDMLRSVDWVVPKASQELMTGADWLMLTLCIYFHDMGLVVTEREFESRAESKFEDFCEKTLFVGAGGSDYRAKVELMAPDVRDRFLYQEFVRFHHGSRIKAWISGGASKELGSCKAQIDLIDKLLAPLGKDFRADLALVCESHNLDDIEDMKKYRQSHPYGNSDEEEANLQYIAALLRTIDLIQITKQRAPSTLYRLIDPSDPVSQQEWAKQAGVTRVRAQMPTDADGAIIEGAQSDTIEIFAQFDDEASFFGLNSYIRYANDQIKATYQIIEKSKATSPKKYSFPWRKVDDKNITARGFVQEPFGFDIDQEKILDLLTGHTLYNDSNVVVREITQNAIDAVRLQFFNSAGGSAAKGRIRIHWDSEKKELSITDNGTGMSQAVIENHLLKVGSSKYQDPKFRETYPNFTPISRFGIGVLSAFMVADKVEITTVSPEEDKARRISLRSVHGKYLIKLLEKDDDAVAKEIGSHGSKFVLRLRASAREIDVKKTLEAYVLVPRCQVELRLNSVATPIKIGFESPKEALEQYLQTPTTFKRYGELKTEVREKTIEGITVSYAMAYSSHYRDWQFVKVASHAPYGRHDEMRAPIVTCVEGIVVQSELVGGIDSNLLAAVNMTGKNAPRTNVARSSLETTSEFDRAVSIVNRILLQAVEEERDRLVKDEEYSLTWAVEQMPFLMHPISGNADRQIDENVSELKSEELQRTKLFLAEENGQRRVVAASDLVERGDFWTVDSMLLTSSEQFIRESKREIARSELLNLVYGAGDNSMTTLLVVPNIGNAVICSQVIQDLFEASHFRALVTERRLDVKWQTKAERWISNSDIFSALMEIEGYSKFEVYSQFMDNSRRRINVSILSKIYLPVKLGEITHEGLDRFHAVKTLRNVYCLPDSQICKAFDDIPVNWEYDHHFLKLAWLTVTAVSISLDFLGGDLSETINYLRKNLPEQLVIDLSEALDYLQGKWVSSSKLELYDPFAWRQRSIDGSLDLSYG